MNSLNFEMLRNLLDSTSYGKHITLNACLDQYIGKVILFRR